VKVEQVHSEDRGGSTVTIERRGVQSRLSGIQWDLKGCVVTIEGVYSDD
jgi:hypothetical protein